MRDLLALCRAALDGTLTYDALQAAAPETGLPLFRAIVDELWDGVEHTPGRVLSRDTNMALWLRTEEYRVCTETC